MEAERVLDNIAGRDADVFPEGYYLYARGWYDQGYQHISRAVEMDPGNEEYRAALRNMAYQASSYRRAGGEKWKGIAVMPVTSVPVCSVVIAAVNVWVANSLISCC